PRPPATRQGQGAEGPASRGATVCPDRYLLGRVAKAGRHFRPRPRISRPHRYAHRRDLGRDLERSRYGGEAVDHPGRWHEGGTGTPRATLRGRARAVGEDA